VLSNALAHACMQLDQNRLAWGHLQRQKSMLGLVLTI